MNWNRVAESLREQGMDAAQKAETIQRRYNTFGTDQEQAKTVERHRINANFCFALAGALEEGMKR